MRTILLLVAAVALAGCAAMRSIDSDVSTYSRWPPERKPATYAFERLPSQQVRPEQQQQLEDAARSAVEAAGFAPAGDPKGADVTVQVGVRVTALDRSPFYDPFWWPYAYPYPYSYYPPRVVYQQYVPPPADYLAPPQGPAPESFWYHCDNPEGYYPYVRQCDGPWQQVPVRPDGSPEGPPPRG